MQSAQRLLNASVLSLVLFVMPQPGLAADEHGSGEAEQLRAIVTNMLDDNTAFVRSHKADYYKPFIHGQHPRATVVTCSDSRVQTHALDKTPDGDLFMVRNIGNQIATAEGSVEYGVRHLHTPLLIIVGHVACGAIQAAQGDYSKESAAIRRELDTIRLPARDPKLDADEVWLQGVKANVDNQVTLALKKFDTEVKDGTLTVIGSVYDFQNAMHQGQGRLVVININGRTDDGSIISALMKMTSTGMRLEQKPPKKNLAIH
ncbi:carbonic anhydrase 2 [mine drainage metagenome]|uniref:carbonic anhydrase n=1 Tax=mine drainage metagenome TaxID=410659 RepID=A0A1J5RQ22_9ZZZZ